MAERDRGEGKVLISVITPVFNREEYLSATIESVLAQTEENFEYILVDDHSSDKSREIILKYANKDPRIRYFFLEKNGGPARARNIGIRSSVGSFIAFLDSDDLWLDSKLAQQVTIFSKCPSIGLIGTNGVVIDQDGKISTRLFNSEKIRDGNISLADYVLKGVPLVTSSVMVRKALLDDCGLFKDYYLIGEDYELWMRIIRKCEINIIDSNLICYRKHLNNITQDKIKNRQSKILIFENEILPSINEFGSSYGEVLSKLQKMYCTLGKYYMLDGCRDKASIYFDKSIALNSEIMITIRSILYKIVSKLMTKH